MILHHMTHDIGGHAMQERLELIELLLKMNPEDRAELISRFEKCRTSDAADEPLLQTRT